MEDSGIGAVVGNGSGEGFAIGHVSKIAGGGVCGGGDC
jgi:hypothetical protein